MRVQVAFAIVVAPLAGARIEINWWGKILEQFGSLPSRERGLKLYGTDGKGSEGLSLHSRERGLKYNPEHDLKIRLLSLPSRERGLKYY